MKRWKNEDAVNLRKQIDTLIPSAIQEVLGYKTVHRVLSSSITHTALEPEGHTITISFSVQVNKKKEKPANDGVSE